MENQELINAIDVLNRVIGTLNYAEKKQELDDVLKKLLQLIRKLD